jgi:hypothetical protein
VANSTSVAGLTSPVRHWVCQRHEREAVGVAAKTAREGTLEELP